VLCKCFRPRGQRRHTITTVDPIFEASPKVQRRIWEFVSCFPLRSLWNLEGITVRVIAKHTWRSLLDDNLVGPLRRIGLFFIFALFPSTEYPARFLVSL
jgi:hypothetical protein